jgi:hypothetical protein
VVVEELLNADGVPGLRAAFTVHCTREKAWRTVTDYPNYPRIFRDIEQLSVLEQSDHGALLDYRIKILLRHYHYVIRREYVIPGQRAVWHRASGDLEVIEGSWEVRAGNEPGTQLLVYESYVRLGAVVPNSLLRKLAVARTKDMGLRVRGWIEHSAPQ